jgi:SAM-dependent methyltransferase
MSLVDRSEIEQLLACPRCRSSLERGDDGLACASEECVYHAPGSFPAVHGWPAVIDFERSVVDAADLQSAPTGDENRWAIERLPRVLRPLLKPRNRVAAGNVDTMLELLSDHEPSILVVGGGVVGNGVDAIYSDPRVRVIGFDIYGTPNVQFIADAHGIPLPDRSVSGVVVQAVIQQLLDPHQAVAEIHRVLKPGGLVYAETPFMQPTAYAGPWDFVRFSSSGHRWLFRAFEEVSAGPVAGPGAALLSSLDHLVRGLLRSELAGKLVRAAFFWLRYLDRLIPTSFAMDNASAYFFLGRRSERSVGPEEIIAYYRGAHHGGGTDEARQR